MNNNFFTKIIYDKTKNKTKGVLMLKEKKEDYIPEIVGLSKTQLFIFIFFAIIFGAGSCSIGMHFASIENQLKIKNKLEHRIAIDLKNEISDKIIYIIIGNFNKLEDAENISKKINTKTGKNCLITTKNGLITVYLGPYNCLSLAKNEIDIINTHTDIKGSIANEI